MSCDDMRALVDAYVDGELDLVRSLDMEKHLENCSACARLVEDRQAIGAALRGGSLYYRMPRELKPRVDAALRRAARPSPPWQRMSWTMLAVAAAMLLAGVFFGRMLPNRTQPHDLVAQAVFDSHLRSLIPGHLADVQSSDRHTVKPWFNGKLDFSPTVNDLADRGFPLAGGRLDYLDNRPVAALVYQRRKHVINLFVWPAPHDPDSGVQASSQQGYNLLRWTKGNMAYWAVSDLNAGELESFAALVRGAP